MRQEAASLQERRAPPSAVVIFGASGDLTQRKLVPALANLVRHRRVTDSLTLVGVGATNGSTASCCALAWAVGQLDPESAARSRS
jgi:glucose-6-phosphate 1-dehydrogenase